MMTAAVILLALALALTLLTAVCTLLLMRDTSAQVKEYLKQSDLRLKRLTSRVRELEVIAGMKPPVAPYEPTKEGTNHEQARTRHDDYPARRHAAGAVRHDNY